MLVWLGDSDCGPSVLAPVFEGPVNFAHWHLGLERIGVVAGNFCRILRRLYSFEIHRRTGVRWKSNC